MKQKCWNKNWFEEQVFRGCIVIDPYFYVQIDSIMIYRLQGRL